jgi:CheY-like chemotaxis protein
MSIRILLADDSITIRKVVGIIFGGEEYSLTVVDNGLSALKKAEEIVPDVLLVDVLMPDMDGYELCKAVRATPALATTPLLLLTGSFEPFDEEKARSCGADDFLAKPFESQQLIAKVHELYQRGLSRTPAASRTEPRPEESPDVQAAPPVTAAPRDIWEAFTVEEEPVVPVDSPPSGEQETCFPPGEPDVFALINEEPEVQPSRTTIPPAGSPWGPADEQTFEFPDGMAVDFPSVPPAGLPSLDGITFDEIADDGAGVPSAAGDAVSGSGPRAPEPPREAVPLSPPGTAPFVAPSSQPEPSPPCLTAPSAQLSEEQLRAAIAGISREVIERVVWEVVPDLAETLIKEAIRTIREGA